jgi:hypothetical protein
MSIEDLTRALEAGYSYHVTAVSTLLDEEKLAGAVADVLMTFPVKPPRGFIVYDGVGRCRFARAAPDQPKYWQRRFMNMSARLKRQYDRRHGLR